MNLDLIRAIDKWVGIPACFAVSMAHKVRDYFKAQPGHEPRQGPGPKRVLFLELSEMGSAILAYPAMKYVLRRYQGAELYFLIFEQNRFSVDMLNIIPRDHVLTISVRSPLHFLASTIKALVTMRKAHLECTYRARTPMCCNKMHWRTAVLKAFVFNWQPLINSRSDEQNGP